MLVEVAERVGPSFPNILRQPFALTLYAHYRLKENDRIREAREKIIAVDIANLNAMAFNDPKMLEREHVAAFDAARSARPSRDQREAADAEFRARAARLVAALEGGKVLED